MKKLLLILLLVCLPVSSATHYSWNEWIKETVFNDKEITGDSQFIHIEAQYRAINGGNVPIKIYTDSPGIVKFTLIIDENPTPCCAIFEFDNIPAYVETNIRVNAYTYFRVVAEDIYGNLYMNTEFIKAAGGCSAPSMSVSDIPLGSIVNIWTGDLDELPANRRQDFEELGLSDPPYINEKSKLTMQIDLYFNQEMIEEFIQNKELIESKRVRKLITKIASGNYSYKDEIKLLKKLFPKKRHRFSFKTLYSLCQHISTLNYNIQSSILKLCHIT